MKHTKIAELLESDHFLQDFTAKGWVRAFRSNRFIALNDGSTINNLQCVVDFENTPEEVLEEINVGAAIEVRGMLKESEGKGQRVEIEAKEIG